MAFRNGFVVGVEIDGIVRASLHARFATDANGLIKFHDPIITFVHGRYRTNLDTRRVGAVIAAGDLKMTLALRVGAHFGVFHPGAVHAQRHIVFTFAGHRTGVTSDAGFVVDHKTKVFVGLRLFHEKSDAGWALRT